LHKEPDDIITYVSSSLPVFKSVTLELRYEKVYSYRTTAYCSCLFNTTAHQ